VRTGLTDNLLIVKSWLFDVSFLIEDLADVLILVLFLADVAHLFASENAVLDEGSFLLAFADFSLFFDQ